MEYPYLGEKVIGDKKVVIMFTNENEGTVVVNETYNPAYKFGLHGQFSEEDFDFFPSGAVVRLSN